MNDDGQTIYIPNPYIPECNHPKPFQYVPKNDKVAVATAKRKAAKLKAEGGMFGKRFSDALRDSLRAVWDAEAKK